MVSHGCVSRYDASNPGFTPVPDVVMATQNAHPPFTPQECQDLMNLLKSSSDEHSGSPIVHTRIVARVLLRKGAFRVVFGGL